MGIYLRAYDFGIPNGENGREAPYPVQYPHANETFGRLVDTLHDDIQEIGRELRANEMAASVGEQTVAHYPRDETEAAKKAGEIKKAFKRTANVKRICEAIVDSYLDSVLEGPVPACEMPDISEFEAFGPQ